MIDSVKHIATQAGDFLLSNFGKISSVISKGDRNFATDLDRKAEEMIVNFLRKEFPGYGVLAEENTQENLNSDFLWIIDPLDGTHNFINNIDIFGVSIGLWHKDDFVLGVVYMPEEKELYYAQKFQGAFKNGKPIKVSDRSELNQASASFDSSIRYSPEIMLKVLDDIAKESFNIRMLGSSVRQLTYIADGRLDFAVEFHDQPWDFAGSVCIIKEAGGIFKDLQGKDPTPKTVGYIAGSSSIYPKVEQIIKKHVSR